MKKEIITPHLPQSFSEALRLLADETDKNEQLQVENNQQAKQIKVDEPKVKFFDNMVDAIHNLSIDEVAEVLNHDTQEFFRILKMDEILTENNLPDINYVDLNYFVVVVWTRGNHSGSVTRVTMRGLKFLSDRYAQ